MGSGPLYLIGWVLMVSVLGGTLGGVYLDRWLGTSPWMTLLGISLGMAAGFTSLFRTLQEQERIRRESDEQQGKNGNGRGN
jgi:ATP synthase protein I